MTNHYILSIIIILIASFLGALGGYFLKKGTGQHQRLVNRFILIGILLYGFAAISTIFSLKYSNLILIFPLTATTYIWTQLIAKRYLKEEINKYKLVGIAFIIVGVILSQL